MIQWIRLTDQKDSLLQKHREKSSSPKGDESASHTKISARSDTNLATSSWRRTRAWLLRVIHAERGVRPLPAGHRRLLNADWLGVHAEFTRNRTTNCICETTAVSVNMPAASWPTTNVTWTSFHNTTDHKPHFIINLPEQQTALLYTVLPS